MEEGEEFSVEGKEKDVTKGRERRRVWERGIAPCMMAYVMLLAGVEGRTMQCNRDLGY